MFVGKLCECERLALFKPVKKRPDEVSDDIWALSPPSEQLDNSANMVESLLYDSSFSCVAIERLISRTSSSDSPSSRTGTSSNLTFVTTSFRRPNIV